MLRIAEHRETPLITKIYFSFLNRILVVIESKILKLHWLNPKAQFRTSTWMPDFYFYIEDANFRWVIGTWLLYGRISAAFEKNIVLGAHC